MDPLSVNAYRELAMAELTASGSTLFGARVYLIGDDFDPGVSLVLTDLTLITQTGLGVQGPLTWSVPYVDPAGRIVVSGGSHTYICGGTLASPLTVFGWCFADATPTDLFATVKLPVPIPINAVGDGFVLDFIVPYGF